MIFGQRPGAAGHQFGGLEHDRIAIGQRGRDFPGGNGDREVPGRDDADRAHGFARHVDLYARPDRGQLVAALAQGLAGVELEDVAGARDFADAFGQRLAFFPRQQPAQLFAAREDFGADAVQSIRAGLRAAEAPCRLGFVRGGDRGFGHAGVGLGIMIDRVARVGRIDVGDAGRAIQPLAGNEVRFHGINVRRVRRGCGKSRAAVVQGRGSGIEQR